MMANRRLFEKATALLLTISLLASTLSGCAKKQADSPREENHTAVRPETITDDSTTTPTQVQAEPVNISYDWVDYVGDIDTVVYGLIGNQYELFYNVFHAVIELPDGTNVYGLGYSDFSDFYEGDDGKGFFPAGFIRLIGEPEIPPEDIEEGLEIQDLENISESSFVYAYEVEPYMEHCVVWGQYLQYGIDESGGITYTVQEYDRGFCNEALGPLYSYDERRFVFDPDVGDYVFVSGTTLSELVDYDAIEAEINRILEQQDFNFSTVDIQTSVYFAQEAVSSYLLSMQEEAFLGVKVSSLVEEIQNLDPTECIRITPDGMLVVDVENTVPENSADFAKWLVGMICGIVIVSSVALEVFMPALRPVSSTISGAAIEAFMQGVIQNQALSNVNWSRVAVAAVSGALLAWACPLAAGSATKGVVAAIGKETVTIFGKEIATEALANLAGYSTQTFSTAMVSGTTGAAFAFIDGGSSDDAFNAFKWGAAIGGASTIFASAFSEISNAGMNALAKSHQNNWLIKASEKVSTFISKHQIHLKNQTLENILAPKSVYEATRCAMNEFHTLPEKISRLPADTNNNFIKVDSKGNLITKEQLLKQGGDCIIKPSTDCDPEILKAFEDHKITEIKVKKGVPDLSDFSEYSFHPKGGIGPNRDVNMKNYYDQLADEWIENSKNIPAKIREVLTSAQIENLDGPMIQKALSAAKLTPHEGTDGVVRLVDSILHSKISHYGGVALAKASASLEVGVTYLKNLAYGSTASITGTLIAEGVN